MAGLAELLNEKCPVQGHRDKTWREVLQLSLLKNFVKGNGTVVNQLMDRLDGVIEEKQAVDTTVRVVYGKRNSRRK